MNALSFYRMETYEISERYITPCFVNGLEAFDGEVNLAFDENLISNKFAVKLCLDYEIIPRLAQGVVDFGNGVITIYLEPDPFEEDSEKTGKSLDDWDQLLDFNFDDVPKSGEELPSFLLLRHLTQEVAGKKRNCNQRLAKDMPVRRREACNLRAWPIRSNIRRYSMNMEKINPGDSYVCIRLERKVNIICSLAVNGSDIILHALSILRTLRKRDMKKEYTTIIVKFLILIYTRDRDAPIVVDSMNTQRRSRIVTHLQEPKTHESSGRIRMNFHEVHHEFVCGWEGCNRDAIVRVRKKMHLRKRYLLWWLGLELSILMSQFMPSCVPWSCSNSIMSLTLLEFAQRLGLYQAVELEEDGFNVYFEGGLHNDDNFNAQDYWLSISQEENISLSRSHTSTIRNPILRFISKLARKCRVLTEDVVRSLSAPIYCRYLDTTTLRDLIDSDGKIILEDPQPGVPRVGSLRRPPKSSDSREKSLLIGWSLWRYGQMPRIESIGV
ncbi:hypothetical protein Tco_1568087 [Tanacetum coccineum]